MFISLFGGLLIGRPNDKRNLQPFGDNIEHFKIQNFVTFLMGPEFQKQLNPDSVGFRISEAL
jgi:hypothetical protein